MKCEFPHTKSSVSIYSVKVYGKWRLEGLEFGLKPTFDNIRCHFHIVIATQCQTFQRKWLRTRCSALLRLNTAKERQKRQGGRY